MSVAEVDLQPYDMAALIPIVEEAGGRFTDVEGQPGPWHGSRARNEWITARKRHLCPCRESLVCD